MLEEKENILRLPIKKSQISLFIYFQNYFYIAKKEVKKLTERKLFILLFYYY